jgi:signal transduction histidine kinase
MAQFGRDSLWAAIAFAWYGLVGQAFTRVSLLPPSTFLNQNLFMEVFGFPVQLLRAIAAGAASAFVVRFLRAFEVERQRQIASLQAARLDEAKKREALRGDLLRRVVEAQEAERQRIARELHDETGQALTAIGLGLRGVEGTIHMDGEKATRNLRHLEELVSHSLDELQRLIADLRPSHLDDLGLPAALRWYTSEVQKRSELDVAVEIEGEEHPIPGTVKIALFRVAQEALTNVLKHASATSAQLWLSFEEENVRIRVWDDGCGFDSEKLAFENAASWGLMGMRERAALLGGEFHILSRPGRGTLVEVTIPYHEDQPGVPFEDIDENEIVVN